MVEDMAEKMLSVFAFSVTCPWFASNATWVAGWPLGLGYHEQLAGNLASSKFRDSCGSAQRNASLFADWLVGLGLSQQLRAEPGFKQVA